MGNPSQNLSDAVRARWGKALRDIAFDAMETMKNNMGGGADESGANESTLDEHLKRWHKGQRPSTPCQWMIAHGMGGASGASGDTGSTGQSVPSANGATGQSGDVGTTGQTGATGGETGQSQEGGEGDKFTGLKDGKLWKEGQELAQTFQDGGTESKYRQMRNKWVKDLIQKGEDGTFDLTSGKPVSYEDGFQVSFQTTSSEEGGVNDADYDKTVDELTKLTGSQPHLGSYGVPEVSFHCSDLKQALEIGKKYNQESVYDWLTGECIPVLGIDKSVNSIEHLKEIQKGK